MDGLVDVTITVEPSVAEALAEPARRDAALRVLTRIVNRADFSELLTRSIAEIKAEARANGLSDDDVDAELDAWRFERSG